MLEEHSIISEGFLNRTLQSSVLLPEISSTILPLRTRLFTPYPLKTIRFMLAAPLLHSVFKTHILLSSPRPMIFLFTISLLQMDMYDAYFPMAAADIML